MVDRSRWLGRGLALVVALVATTGGAFAQLQTGNIYGTTLDNQGEALPGVTVTLEGAGAPKVQTSDASGVFRFLGLPPGTFSLKAVLEGFSPLDYPNVVVNVGRNTTIEMTLTAAVEEVVTVTAESPLLDERRIGTGATVNQTELEKVPTSRDPWAVLGTVPGVLTDRINVGGNESGQQSQYVGPGSGGDQAVWAVDGVVITDMGAIGSSPTYYNFDAFEEMQVTTGGTDTSLATGGVTLNMVTKRGTNQWRASGRFIYAEDSWQSDTDLDEGDLATAGPWNRNNAQPAFKQGNRIVSVEDYGADVGGPIVQDKLWIWANYGVQEVDLLTIADVSDFTELETYGAKLNAQLGSSNSATFFYNYGDKIKNGRNAGPTRPQETTWNQTGPTDIWKLEDTHIFASNFYLTGMASDVGGGFQLTPQGGLGGPTSEVFWTSGVWRDNFLHHETDRPQEQARLDGSYFFNTGTVSHELKFGAGYRTADLDSFSIWPGNGYSLDLSGLTGGVPYDYFVVAAPRVSSATTDYTSAFVQDTLTAGRLTANFGVRYDKQSGDINAVDQPGLPGFEFTGIMPTSTPGRDQGFEWEDVTPRLGLTYALGEERKTLLRASYSRFADQLAQAFSLWHSPVTYRYSYWSTYGFNIDADGDGIFEPGEVAGADFYGDNFFDPTQTRSRNIVDPDFEAPLTDEILLSVEHALRPEFVVGLNLTLRNVSNMAQAERLVYCAPGESGCFVNEFGDAVRVNRRSDWTQAGSINQTRPDGSLVSQPFFGLIADPRLVGVSGSDTGGGYLFNGDIEQDYTGVSVTFNKRLANRWMLRGNFTWSDWEWDVPASAVIDPNTYLGGLGSLGVGGGSADDGDSVLQGSGTGSGAKGAIYINSEWSYDITGLYQIAPDRPWGFNVSGHVYGREGYPIPYFQRASCVTMNITNCGGNVIGVAVAGPDEFRNDDIHLVDVRLEKDFQVGELNFTVLGEVFNIFNEATALQKQHRLDSPGSVAQIGGGETLRVNGSDFVTEVISPRVFRLGARFNFR
jgi:hypothetical protein